MARTTLIPSFNSSTNLAAVLIAGVAIVVGTITWLDIRQAKSEFFAATELRAIVLAGSIAEIIADPVYMGDVDKIRDVARVARQQEDLELLQVVAPDGRLLVDPMNSGPAVGVVKDQFVLASVLSQSAAVQRNGATIHVIEPIEAGAQFLGAVHVMYGNASLGQYVSELTRQRVMIGMSLALASFVAALIVARIITSPMRNLTSAANRLANGRLETRVTPRGPREFRELAHMFNEMAHRLQRSHAELTELNQAKTRFFSSVTHELKTPLTASASFTDLLASDPDNRLNQRQKQFIEVIKRNHTQLLDLIDELLEMGQAESGTIRLSMAIIDLNELVADVVENMTPAASEKGQSLQTVPFPGPLRVHADRARMEQVLTNLVSNALKYSERGAGVEIKTRVMEKTASVTVEDNGIGIPQDELENLFFPFHRTPEAIRSGIGGAGLGLYVVDTLVRLHGGTISVKSDPGIGSAFSVALPLAEPSKTGESYASG